MLTLSVTCLDPFGKMEDIIRATTDYVEQYMSSHDSSHDFQVGVVHRLVPV